MADPIAHVTDDVGVLREALSDAAATCDVVISSGGVSAGEADHLPALLAELGRVDFWKVRMKPGLPFLCGEIGKAIVFGLPGNPVSSLATFLTLVQPGLMTMQGASAGARTWRAQLTAPIRKKHERTEYLRARLESGDDGVLRATPVERQGSGMMGGVAEADALIVVPERSGALAEGDVVDGAVARHRLTMSAATHPHAQHRAAIREIDPAQALGRQRADALLIDVRDDNERGGGMPDGAIGLARADIPARIREIAADPAREILTICATGRRSLLAAETLRDLGYANVASVRGGFRRWQAEGLPVARGALDGDAAERYARHLVLPEVGIAGQQKLLRARVALSAPAASAHRRRCICGGRRRHAVSHRR